MASLMRILERLPWWAGALFGLCSLVLGAVLILRLYLSPAALLILLTAGLLFHGVVLLLQRRGTGLLWLTLGLAVLLLPGLSIAVLALLLGVALIIEGLTDGTRALRKRDWAELMSAATSLILGVLALSWPVSASARSSPGGSAIPAAAHSRPRRAWCSPSVSRW